MQWPWLSNTRGSCLHHSPVVSLVISAAYRLQVLLVAAVVDFIIALANGEKGFR